MLKLVLQYWLLSGYAGDPAGVMLHEALCGEGTSVPPWQLFSQIGHNTQDPEYLRTDPLSGSASTKCHFFNFQKNNRLYK